MNSTSFLDDLDGTAEAREAVRALLHEAAAVLGMQLLPSVHEQSVAAANAVIDYLEQRPGVLIQVDTVGWQQARTLCCASRNDAVEDPCPGVRRRRRSDATDTRPVSRAPEDEVAYIAGLKDMARVLDALSADALERRSEWENLQVFDMLESMGAWLSDTADREGQAHPVLSAEQWQFVARLLLAGKHYE